MPSAQEVAGEDRREGESVEVARLRAVMRGGAADQRLPEEEESGHPHERHGRALLIGRGNRGRMRWRSVPRMPTESLKSAEGEEDEPGPAQKEDEADTAIEHGSRRRIIARERLVGEVAGIGISLS